MADREGGGADAVVCLLFGKASYCILRMLCLVLCLVSRALLLPPAALARYCVAVPLLVLMPSLASIPHTTPPPTVVVVAASPRLVQHHQYPASDERSCCVVRLCLYLYQMARMHS